MSKREKFIKGLEIFSAEKSRNLSPIGVSEKTERRLRNSERMDNTQEMINKLFRFLGGGK